MFAYSTTLPHDLAAPLVADPAAVLVVHLVQTDSWSSVAAYSLTGTLTSPKVIAPFQIARMTTP